ncbi:hypothetical protein AB0O34_03110 [Sphaerisporangium sp. NPDC088356]|uniref:hypothetical protein n=1 Tax=Sphaerisporangium sp. NPDC088356 TaxID=3154871 RepID=UPI00342B8189
MTPSLIDQRPRGELIAELYDRHAAGLFAYCHDQLGDTASAADALTAVLTNVPVVEPPRAALYALARREIYRRDVAYVLPSVDPAADPATALIERVVREVRPHQREVLLLSAICGLDTAELAWVLDVAADTAEQLELSARQRFSHSLAAAVAAVRSGAAVPARLAEAYAALAIAPAEDALARLPWRRPSGGLRVKILSAIPEETRTAGGARSESKRLWPTTPRWPLPLAEPNPFTNTGVFPAKELSPPEPGHRSGHEAATEPMPKIRASRPGAPDAFPRPRRRRQAAATAPLTAPVAPVAPDVPGTPAASAGPPAATPRDAFGTAARHDLPAMPLSAPVAFPDVLVASSDVSAFFPAIPVAPAGPEAPPADGAPAVDRPSDTGRDWSPEKSSSFSEALATGNWPTLRRTFGGRPSPEVDGPASGSPGRSASRRASRKAAGDTAAQPVAQPAEARGHKSADRRASFTLPAALAELRARFGAAARTRTPAEPEAPTEPETPARPEESPAPGDVAAVTTPDATSSAWETTALAGETASPEKPMSLAEPVTGKVVDGVTEPATAASVPEQTRAAVPGQAGAAVPGQAGAAVPGQGTSAARPRRHDRPKPIKLGEHHYDWLWEVAGFILCVAIAMIVFFAVPTIVTP